MSRGARVRVMVKALCYKPEGREFETRLGVWMFSVYLIFSAVIDPGGSLSLQQKWIPEAEK
jgi:hypothetical protein